MHLNNRYYIDVADFKRFNSFNLYYWFPLELTYRREEYLKTHLDVTEVPFLTIDVTKAFVQSIVLSPKVENLGLESPIEISNGYNLKTISFSFPVEWDSVRSYLVNSPNARIICKKGVKSFLLSDMSRYSFKFSHKTKFFNCCEKSYIQNADADCSNVKIWTDSKIIISTGSGESDTIFYLKLTRLKFDGAIMLPKGVDILHMDDVIFNNI